MVTLTKSAVLGRQLTAIMKADRFDCLNSSIAIFTPTESRIISTDKGESDVMKKVILSILVAVAVFFVIVVIQTLVRNMTFTEALSRPYNFFLAAIVSIGTFKSMSRKGKK